MPARRPPTPRALMLRVSVAALVAAILGAAPAVAWDASTALPRPRAKQAVVVGVPSPPSRWLRGLVGVKRMVKGLALTYFPPSEPPASDAPLPVAVATAVTGPAPTPTIVYPTPTVVHPRPPTPALKKTTCLCQEGDPLCSCL